MNKVIAIVLIVATLLAVAMGLFPPWVATIASPERTVSVPFGYHFILRKRFDLQGQGAVVAYSIDIARLIVQWLTLGFAVGGLRWATAVYKRGLR